MYDIYQQSALGVKKCKVNREVRCHRGRGYMKAMQNNINDVLLSVPRTPLFSYRIL